jgi:C-8 sterol isomerase
MVVEMAPKKPSSSRPKQASASSGIPSLLVVFSALTLLLSGVFYFLDSHLDWFYIFTPPQLHDLSQRAIAAHGNDTTSVVKFIVGELSEKLPGGYVNLDEEWIFNNAGGAMGAMYIIHASEFPRLFLSCPSSLDRDWVTPLPRDTFH